MNMDCKGRKEVSVLFFLILFLLFALSNAAAQDDNPRLALNITVEREVSILKEGKRIVERIPAERAEKGDILVYTIEYTNEGKTGAKDASIIDPIPEGTVYILGSAEGDGSEITYSIDGGNLYQRPPVKYRVRKPDGTRQEKIAPANMYTHIKWVIGKTVLPGQSGKVSFKVEVK